LFDSYKTNNPPPITPTNTAPTAVNKPLFPSIMPAAAPDALPEELVEVEVEV